MVMDHFRKEQFLRGTYNKIKYKKISPCQILKKISNNTYHLNILKFFDISPTFNVADLYEYHEGDKSTNEGTLSELEQQLPIISVEHMEKIIATRIGKKTHQKECQE